MWSCSKSVGIITGLEEPIGDFCVRFSNLKGSIFSYEESWPGPLSTDQTLCDNVEQEMISQTICGLKTICVHSQF